VDVFVDRSRIAEEGSPGTAGVRPDSLGRAGISTVVVSLLAVAIGFVSNVILARGLGPAGKGSYDLAVVAAALVAMVIGLSLPGGITLAVARGLASPRPLLRLLMGFAALQVAVAYGILWLVSLTPLSSAMLPPNAGPAVIALMAVLTGATNGATYVRAALIGLQRIVAANLRDLWGRAAALAMLIGVVVLSGQLHVSLTPGLALGVTVAGSLLALLFMLQAIMRLRLPRRAESGIRRVGRFAAPLYAGNLVQFLNYRLDVFLVAAFVGVREVGLYALAVTLGQLTWIVSNSLATVLMPRVAASSQDDAAREAARLTRIALAIAAAGGLALAVIATPFIDVVYGAAYHGAVAPLLVLLPGVVVFSAVNVLAAYIAGLGHLRVNVVISLIGLTATLTLDLLLIPRVGAVGAAFASTVSYSMSAIVTLLWARRLSGLPVHTFVFVRRADVALVLAAVRRGAP
jgi:O-antigen/teichoic acid export membrane protein